MPRDGRRKTKHWCWTLNNFTDDDVALLRRAGESKEDVDYLIFGREVGANGTPHLQGFVSFINRKYLSGAKKFLDRAHWEPARGTPVEALSYCKKEGDFEEFGSPPAGRGRRTDLEEIREAIRGGIEEAELADSYFSQWCQYRRSFAAFAGLLRPPLSRPELQVYLLHGPTGSGKTRFASQWSQENGGVWMSGDPKLQWFDGYGGEPNVIIDDFAGEAPFRFLLRVLDIYPIRVPIKGGFAPFNATRIFITANSTPEYWYPLETDISPLRRRIARVIIVDESNELWERRFEQLVQRCGL